MINCVAPCALLFLKAKNGINDNGDEMEMKSIEEKVTAFRNWLLENKHRKKTYVNMVAQIDKYWGKTICRSDTCRYPERSHHNSPSKDEQYSGEVFPGCETTRSEKNRHGFVE